MKKLIFFVASAFVAVAGYCSSVGDKVVAKVTNSDPRIEQQQGEQLVLEAPTANYQFLADHSSHASHASHSSHASHFSSR